MFIGKCSSNVFLFALYSYVFLKNVKEKIIGDYFYKPQIKNEQNGRLND